MSEAATFFGSPSEPIFGVLHEPQGATRRLGFVFCHPFAEEKLWAHRVFVTYARRLAQRGHAVLRFDFRGTGDSGGTFSRTSLTTAIEDVGVAVDYLRQRTQSADVGLLGLRLGASIACIVADQRPDVGPLVLWAPIVDGGRYMQETLRTNLAIQLATYKEVRQDREALASVLTGGGTVNVDGYELGLSMYSEVSALHLAKSARTRRGPALVLGVERQPNAPADLKALAASFAVATLNAVQEEPFWKEIPRYYQEAPDLFAATDDWIDAL